MWKRQLIGFEVLVDPVIDMFGPPDVHEAFVLHGKVRVVTSRPLRLKELLVSFHGTTQVNKEDSPRKVLSYLDLTLKNVSLLLPGTPSILPAGVSDFPFELSLPGDLPPSINQAFGNVQYKTIAILISSRKLLATYKVHRPMILHRHYLPSRLIIPHVPKLLLQSEREGKMKCKFNVPSLVWIQTEKIRVEGMVMSLVEEARIANILMKLEQSEAFRTISKDSYRPSFFVFDDDPQQFLVVPVLPYTCTLPTDTPLGTEIPISLDLSIKSPRVKSRVDSPLLEVEHILRIRVSFLNPDQKPLWFSTPITVTTVPSPSTSIVTTSAANVVHHGEVLPGYNDAYAGTPTPEASRSDLLALAAVASQVGLPDYSLHPEAPEEPVASTPSHLAEASLSAGVEA